MAARLGEGDLRARVGEEDDAQLAPRRRDRGAPEIDPLTVADLDHPRAFAEQVLLRGGRLVPSGDGARRGIPRDERPCLVEHGDALLRLGEEVTCDGVAHELLHFSR